MVSSVGASGITPGVTGGGGVPASFEGASVEGTTGGVAGGVTGGVTAGGVTAGGGTTTGVSSANTVVPRPDKIVAVSRSLTMFTSLTTFRSQHSQVQHDTPL